MRVEPFDPDTAERQYREILVLAAELGMRPLVAHCHLGLGTLYRRTGEHEQAHEHLNTAMAMYREMDMAFWVVQSERETKELAREGRFLAEIAKVLLEDETDSA